MSYIRCRQRYDQPARGPVKECSVSACVCLALRVHWSANDACRVAVSSLLFAAFSSFGALSASSADEIATCIFDVINVHDGPVLKKGDPGTEGNKYGFEGGRAFRFQDEYHLFTSETIGDPKWVMMRLAHWKSADGIEWRRVSTLYESSGEFTGADQRAALWSPMPYYNEREKRWNLTYVAYRCKPNSAGAWHTNYDGRICRAVSSVRGLDGLDGPYVDLRVMLEPGPDSGGWEGLQGVDSFFMYPVGDGWCALYGSAKTEHWPCEFWGLGLASAPEMAGPWKRRHELNPVDLGVNSVENPVVTRLANGVYIALVDGGGRTNRFGYTVSKDGIHWCQVTFIDLTPPVRKWWTVMRTPLGLIDEGDDVFTLFFTAVASEAGMRHEDLMTNPSTYGSLGVVRLRLRSPDAAGRVAPGR